MEQQVGIVHGEDLVGWERFVLHIAKDEGDAFFAVRENCDRWRMKFRAVWSEVLLRA